MNHRGKRIDELFQEEISSYLARTPWQGMKGLVTVTSVKVTKHLETAIIYFSVFGSPSDVESTTAVLNAHKQTLMAHLRGRIRLHRLPALEFQYDDTPLKASRIERAFMRIESEKADKDENI